MGLLRVLFGFGFIKGSIRVWGLGFRNLCALGGAGFRVWGSGFRVWGFGVLALGVRVWGDAVFPKTEFPSKKRRLWLLKVGFRI